MKRDGGHQNWMAALAANSHQNWMAALAANTATYLLLSISQLL